MRGPYTFHIDAAGRTRKVEGRLYHSEEYLRSRRAQLEAGGEERLATDEGGHIIASRFGGPTDAFNHFAQNRNFNRSGYAKLENGWDRLLDDGQDVFVTIEPQYEGASTRPSSLEVSYKVGDKLTSNTLRNRSGLKK